MDKFNLKKYLAEGKLVKESLQQLTPEEKNYLKELLGEKIEDVKGDIDWDKRMLKDKHTPRDVEQRLAKHESEFELVKNILNKL